MKKIQRRTYAGNRNPNWRGGGSLERCARCDGEYLARHADVGKRRFCSRLCSSLWASENPSTKPRKPRRRRSLSERLPSHFKRGSPDRCWNWKGTKGPGGYGKIADESGEGRHIQAHRASYIVHVGKIPKGMLVCHHCDNRLCVNPRHLFLGTVQDNNQDKVNKRRHPRKLSESQVREIRKLAKSGSMSDAGIGKLFGVCGTNVGAIRKQWTWRWLK